MNEFDKTIRYKCPVCKEYTPCEIYGTLCAPYNNPTINVGTVGYYMGHEPDTLRGNTKMIEYVIL